MAQGVWRDRSLNANLRHVLFQDEPDSLPSQFVTTRVDEKRT